ncbi:hypothetical protein EST38_g11021 [Candolleomyces aberdarensis]|uniref:Uncharacterized protein n=1 Tax=Candolleomyces aberdarensis TaxID=2316362 RepID=A0A4Q2D7H8_9AGAR|nr:hypothetical protein EST38_g11021 [Candolleomyces aberdarensis]
MFSTALWCALPSVAVVWVTGVVVMRYLQRRKYPVSFSSPSSFPSPLTPLTSITSLLEIKAENPSMDVNTDIHLTVLPPCLQPQLASLDTAVQEKAEDCDTPRALAFTTANHPTPFNSAIAFRKLLEWDESNTPTPRGSVCLPLNESESPPALNIEQEQVGVEGRVNVFEKETGLELDCINVFPSPPPSPPLITPGNPGERRLVVRPLAESSSSTPSTTTTSATLTTLDDDDTETEPALPAQPLLVAQPPTDSQSSFGPEQRPRPQAKETFDLIFDPTSNRYILPPSVSQHVSHLRYHLSRAYEHRKAEEALKEARAKLRGEVRAFEGRWRGKGRRRGREKDRERDAGETKARIRALQEGVSKFLRPSPPGRPASATDYPALIDSEDEDKSILKIEDPISPSRFLSILQSRSPENALGEVDVKLKLWEGWEWDVDVEWELEVWKPSSNASSEAEGDAATPIYLPHLKRLGITAVDAVPLRPIFERMKAPLLEEICIAVTASSFSSPGGKNPSTRQSQKVVQRCLEGDPWTALDRAEGGTVTPVHVELRLPHVQFNEEKWVEEVKRVRCQGRVVRC